MMLSLETLVSTYGYAAIAVGSFLEGETVLVLGGFAAHRGYLELPWVIFYAFLGSLAGDQLYFFIGRYKGKSLLERHTGWRAKSEKVFNLLYKHQTLLILGFRFLYGLRTVTPFIIGASNVPPLRFFILNVIGAAIWAGTIGTLGYLFGHTLEIIIGDTKKYELSIFAAMIAIAVIIWSMQYFKKK